jgi:hypothetical protein
MEQPFPAFGYLYAGGDGSNSNANADDSLAE